MRGICHQLHSAWLTAWVLCLMPVPAITQELSADASDPFTYHAGAIIRGDRTERAIALVFTGDQYADGLEHITEVLESHKITASFFLTGNFYRDTRFSPLVSKLRAGGHYLGAHSDRHLLYCDWGQRDSLLVTRDQFDQDLETNLREMERFGIGKDEADYFLPPYEWYNDSISAWTREKGMHLINYSPGTLSHADYTVPGTDGYRSSSEILDSILSFEERSAHGLNGFILLMHAGSAPERTDKFYPYIETLIGALILRGYRLITVPELLGSG